GLAARSADLAGGGCLRAAARGGRDVPRPGPHHDRTGSWLPSGAALPGPGAGGAGAQLRPPRDRLPRLVLRVTRKVELHDVRRRLSVRAGSGLRGLHRAAPAVVRETAVPYAAAVTARGRFLHVEPGVAAVDVHAAARQVQGLRRPGLQPADPAAPAACLRRSCRPRLRLRLLPGPRRRPGALSAGLPDVPD